MFDSPKIFNVYVNRSKRDALEDAQFIKEGFSFFAFILPLIWALWNRVWLVAGILLVVNIGFGILSQQGLLSEAELAVLQLGIAFYLGFEACDLHGKILQKRGYQLEAVVVAKNLLEAQQRFFDNKTTAKPGRKTPANLNFAAL